MTRTKLNLPTVLAASAVTLAIGFTTRPAAAQVSGAYEFASVTPGTVQRVKGLPRREIEVRLRDFRLAGPARVYAGPQVVRLINDGPAAREAVLVQLAPGKSQADLASWFRAGMQGAAPGTFVGGTIALAPGGQQTIVAELARGAVLLLAYEPDQGERGEPHVVRGTILAMTVN